MMPPPTQIMADAVPTTLRIPGQKHGHAANDGHVERAANARGAIDPC